MVYSSENSKVDEREKFADKIVAHSYTESVLRHNETCDIMLVANTKSNDQQFDPKL